MKRATPQKKARQHLLKARQLMNQRADHRKYREDQIIAAARATREQLWEARLAARP